MNVGGFGFGAQIGGVVVFLIVVYFAARLFEALNAANQAASTLRELLKEMKKANSHLAEIATDMNQASYRREPVFTTEALHDLKEQLAEISESTCLANVYLGAMARGEAVGGLERP